MYPSLKNYCDNLITQFSSISDERKKLLEQIAGYVKKQVQAGDTAQLMYICTHNSRRSHFGQVWAQAAANYYGIKNIYSYSGGTEATAFNINAINALTRAGFIIERAEEGANPVYYVNFDDHAFPCTCFSKVYSHEDNPLNKYAAIMTCSEAEQNCPVTQGMDIRIGLTYEDPKAFDNTDLQDAKYDERCKQIALETLYLFSLVSKN